MRARNILSLTSEEKRKFLDSFDHVFSDIDGVVFNYLQDIEGSGDGFKELQNAGKDLTFITNNSVRHEDLCIQKLRKKNIQIEANNIMHPAKSIVEYLNSIKFDGLIYILAAEEFKNVLRRAGYKLLDGPNVIINEALNDILSHMIDQQPVKAVVVDFDFNLSFVKILKAIFYLKQPDCLLIGGATDVCLHLNHELSLCGPGPFINVLEKVSRKESLIFGKPGKGLAQVLMQRSRIPSPDRVLMIGDMLEQDVRFANSCGFQSLLVLTGGSSYEDLMGETDSSCIPNYFAHSMLDFVEFMKDLKNCNA